MTTNIVTTTSTATSSVGLEPDSHTLVGEHILLVRGVHQRVVPVLARIDSQVWPTEQLSPLIGFLRVSLSRQASDEEVLLFPNGSVGRFGKLNANHVRLHTLTEELAQATEATCSLPKLRGLVDELVQVLERHVVDEQTVLAGLAATRTEVPSVADLAAGGQAWLASGDAPLMILLDVLPGDERAQLCIERLLRLRPGQSAEIRSAQQDDLRQVSQWMRSFDSATYGTEYVSDTPDESHLHITRRREG